MATGQSDTPPRWDLTPIYSDFSGRDFKTDLENLEATITEFRTLAENSKEEQQHPGTWLKEVMELYNRAADLYENLESYCYCRYSVETDNEEAVAALNRVEEFTVSLSEMEVLFRNALAKLEADPEDIIDGDEELEGYTYFLEEQLFLQTHQLSAPEENLAADLNRAGGNAWSRMHGTISSQLSTVWDEKTGERKTVVDLRNMAMDPDRKTRKKAWELELRAWESVETPFAFAINGVKGFSHMLNSRRGWKSTLERSTRQSRISEKTLESLLGAMRDSLPLFRRYFSAKAKMLDLPVLSFYDLFAPLKGDDEAWPFSSARDYIVKQFDAFAPDLGSFARHAFSAGWIDAESRKGKVGGGYCIDMPVAAESRILTNFDGTYDGLGTLAHELGHAYHTSLLRDLPATQRNYPMTLAETASIFSETLVFSRRLAEAPETRKAIVLEPFLQGASQVVVDILSRFEFESRLMERRASGEASPRELKQYMLEAQEATYGAALNPEERHPYMWAVKGHYYNVDLAFYNFPYAFGLLFGMGLFSLYRKDPETFPELYRNLLRETGRNSAEAVTRTAGFDIETRPFWDGAIAEVGAYVEQFERLT